MSKRIIDHDINERYKAVMKVLEERESLNSLTKAYGVTKTTLKNWVRKYNADGIEGLKESKVTFLLHMYVKRAKKYSLTKSNRNR
ncbi:helix-turn-helix domain-containing protein [Alkalibacterium sp. AK22]|uniref:helix-turn-helix domain-containing protein n=1 Tax=Alkalibacterium sp. AK22 TaxID=1229520 RepID=UPI000688BA4A